MSAMQPLLRTILDFDGFEMFAFWLGVLMSVTASGFFLDLIMQSQGFGVALNGLLAFAGAIMGLLLRYNWFQHAPWYNYEPYLTVGSCLGGIAVLILSLAFARNLLWR